ncbi:MAG: ATP-binding cassette domain-containing protein, partial [Cyanothece sp. SIO2G6]|nr:ATP-binding cassette domain-containing protein [Cyanothece sp. SIO2G6]
MPGRGRIWKDLSIAVGSRSLAKKLSGGVEPGEGLALVGKSGCGKTTLLETLAGFQEAATGQLSWTSEHGKVERSNISKSKIGYISQDLALPSELSA